MSQYNLHILKQYILDERLNNSNLYKPLGKCYNDGNIEIIHSNYVYKRLNLGEVPDTNDNIDLNLVNLPQCSNDSNLICISVNDLNNLIQEDNDILQNWLYDVEEYLRQFLQKDEIIKLSDDDKKRLDYFKNLKNQLGKSLQNKNKKYSIEEIRNLPDNCNIFKNLDFNIIRQQFITDFEKLEGKVRNYHQMVPIDFGFFSAIDSGITSQELQESRNLLQKIINQITTIEMKTQINKTKLGTLVQQYGALKQLRQNFDKRIIQMQKQIDTLNVKRMELTDKIDDLQLELRSVKKNKENLKKEIVNIKKDNELASEERREKIRKLTNVQVDLEKNNFELKKRMANLISQKDNVENQNKQLQTKLLQQKEDLQKTENNLQKISQKLDTLNVKVSENTINEKLLEPEELNKFQQKMAKMLKESEKSEITPEIQESTDDDMPIILETPVRKTPVRKTKTQLAKKTNKPRIKKTKKQRNNRVDNLILFGEEEKEIPKPKRRGRKKTTKSRSKKRSKEIKVKVKKSRIKKSKRKKKDDEDEELIFNFSLRNLM